MGAASELDPYVVLGVARSAKSSEIRAAYRSLMARYHPDLHQGNPLEELAAARAAEINRAYEILADTSRRATYDIGAQTSRRSNVPGEPAAAPGSVGKRLVRGGLLLLALALLLRLGLVAVRGLGMLASRLFEGAGAIGGGRVAALVAALAVVVLLFALRWRRRSGR